MKILVLNSGSSTVKYALYESQNRITGGLVERVTDYDAAINDILKKIGHVDAVGHRVVHGGEFYKEPVLIDGNVIGCIEGLIPLAPLHNPANVAGIKSILKHHPDIPQVAVFDTSFHQSIPEHAYRYALPESLYISEKIRRYGFHGISHRYLAKAASDYLGKPLASLNLITFHLGNGDSICAIRNGISIDTSMGFTPLEGLIMGTRSGDVDPEILLYLQKHRSLGVDEIDHLLNKESGLKGICGLSDMRDVVESAQKGDEKAQLAIKMFTYHAKKYLGAYLAVLGRVDAVVFSGGIGEHSALIRAKILEELEPIGIHFAPKRNRHDTTETFEITTDASHIKVLVIHTEEEKEIAEETMNVLTS